MGGGASLANLSWTNPEGNDVEAPKEQRSAPGPSNAPAPPPAAPPPVGQPAPPPVRRDLSLTFLTKENEEKSFTFKQRPLGFEIMLNDVPIVLAEVYADGRAGGLGVCSGWIIQKVNGEEISKKDFDTQFSILKKAMAYIPLDAPRPIQSDARGKPCDLEIVFESANSVERAVTFSKKPLGFEFNRVAPIQVSRIKDNASAQRHGIEVGWVIKRVAGEDMTGKSFGEQYALLKRCVTQLPDVTHSIAPPAFSMSGNLASGNSGLAPTANITSSVVADTSLTLTDGRL
mmetsp:Transcript_52404/g.94068  ORF Transcript_52404/g.94068 Transcript_52404/m.94068 type:complete len:287 (-) Transcript_52404:4-864(-)